MNGPSATSDLPLNGAGLTPAAVVEVAREERRVAIEPAAHELMSASRAVVERYVAEGRPAYGLTTGLGARVTQRLPDEILSAFSRMTVLGRAHAVGPRLPKEAVRAILLVRLNGLLTGGAGINPGLADLLAAMLNRGVHPVLPAIGSIGAGDLCLLATLMLGVIGEGEAEHRGEIMPAAQALARARLAPAVLGPKDGLALINASAGSVGLAALTLADFGELLELATLAAALSMEGFRASLYPIDSRVAASRPQPGQVEIAARLRAHLAGGTLNEPGAARRLQDPISFRCVSQVHGSLHAALAFADAALEPELNGAGDNPLVLVPGSRPGEGGEILSTGNFHTPGLALALDAVALGTAQVANLAANRAARLLAERLTGLPANLSPRAREGRSGLAPLLKVAEALAAEIRSRASPVCIDSRIGADGVEDDSTNAPLAARKLGEIVEPLRLLIALELVVAAQAVDFAKPARLGHGTAAAQAIVRELVPTRRPAARRRCRAADAAGARLGPAACRSGERPGSPQLSGSVTTKLTPSGPWTVAASLPPRRSARRAAK